MPHISPERAQELRESTQPGPWRAISDYPDHDSRPDRSRLVYSPDSKLMGIVWEGGGPLVAAAPELAKTVAEMRYEYEVQVRYHDHELVDSEWYPCDANAMTHIDHCDGGKPWRWVAPKAWDTLESAEETAEALRTFEDRDVRIVGRLVYSLGVVG